jgi:hypothetical protein
METVIDELKEALQHVNHAFFACIGNEPLRDAIYAVTMELERLEHEARKHAADLADL